MSKLITPTPHQRIPISACHYYKCCANCVYFACYGVPAPKEICVKLRKLVEKTNHCKKFEER